MSKKQNIITPIILSVLMSLLLTFTSIFAVIKYYPNLLFSIDSQDANTEEVQNNKIVEVTSSSDDLIIDLVAQTKPAVVSIIISKQIQKQRAIQSPLDNFFFFGNPFQSPYQQVDPEVESNDNEPEFKEIGGGTGFFIREDGLILTNKHVVDDKNAKYTVMTNSGKIYDAEVKARDPFFDLAIIQILDTQDTFPILTLGESDKVRVGQTTLAIGNALAELSGSVTKGIISGLERTTIAGDGHGMQETLYNVIQIDTAINPGNSGGPLIDLNGKVIGINTAVANADNIGFALPINDAKQAVESYFEYGKISRPKLGLRYIILTPQIQKANDLDYDYGAIVIRGKTPSDLAVIPGGPADKAGIEENDIILEINDVKITEDNPLIKETQTHKIGDTLKMKISHDGEEKDIEIVLDEISEK